MSDVENILESLRILTCPDGPGRLQEERKEAGKEENKSNRGLSQFEKLLTYNINKLKKTLLENKDLYCLREILPEHLFQATEIDSNPCYVFLQWNLELISALRHTIDDALKVYSIETGSPDKHTRKRVPAASPDTFRVTQQKTIQASLQFIVLLGVCPHLLPGVGIPVHLRSDYGPALQASCEQKLPITERLKRLLQCLKMLVGAVQQPVLGSLILSKHLSDILAGLIQLLHAPLKLRSKENTADISKEKLKGPLAPEDREWVHDQLSFILDKSYQPLVVRELLALQTVAPPPPAKSTGKAMMIYKPPPAWFRRVCRGLLSQRIMKSRGVVYVLEGMLEGLGGGPSGDEAAARMADWARCDAAAKLIAFCPQQDVTADEYYRAVIPQVMGLLQCQDKRVSQRYTRVAGGIITAILDIHPELISQLILDKLHKPFMVCQETQGVEPGHVLVTEDTIQVSMETIHKLYVLGAEPNKNLLMTLLPVLRPLCDLYISAQGTITHIKSMVEELLVRFLQHVDGAVSMETLVTMAYGNLDNQLQRGSMCHELAFVAAANGGMQIVGKSGTSEEDILSFTKPVAPVIKLLKDLSDKDLQAKFFVYILKKMTRLLTKKEDTGPETANTPSTLVDLEQRQQRTTEEIQTALVTFDIISNMVEHVGDSCFRDIPQILDFAKVILEHSIQTGDSDKSDMMEGLNKESLSLAMGILGTLLIAAEDLTLKDKEQLKDLLPVLAEIEASHSESQIRDMASDLRIAIATHGMVQAEAVKAAAEYLKKLKLDKPATETATDTDENMVTANVKQQSSHKPKIQVVSTDSMSSTSMPQQASHSPKIEVLSSGHGQQSGKTKKDVLISESDQVTQKTRENMEKQERDILSSVSDKVSEDMRKQSRENDTDILHSQNVASTIHAVEKDVCTTTDKKDERVLSETVYPDETGQSRRTENTKEKTSSEITNTNGSNIDKSSSGTILNANKSPSGQDESNYSKAMREVNDPLIPVKGHGLIIIKRLLEERDPETMSHAEMLCTACRTCLEHEDTYVYLSAIQCLVVLGDHLPRKVLPLLAHEYANFRCAKDPHEFKNTELRLKLGEVIVKVTRGLGDLAPSYRDLLLPVMLHGARDADSLIRASSLSNLAELCKLLRFSIGSIIHEVFECCSSLLKSDAAAEVREAAGMLITLLLQGLGKDALKVLDKVLRHIYRVLKLAYQNEADDKVRVHIAMALEELDSIMREYLFPKQTLTKKIRVLSAD